MTVEQHPLPRYTQQRTREDHSYAQIREITGITDKQVIHHAINACKNNEGNYEVDEVVNMLIMDDPLKNSPQKQKVLQAHPTEDTTDANPGVKLPTQKKNQPVKEVIDLTTEKDAHENDIRKAIQASLEDNQETSGILGGQVSREEQDISRVLEQSLIENKAGTKRKRGDIWFIDPLNPHERKRQEGWPIGLKNVGNTCWFSAVIQSLFHLRRFRHLVLSYQPPKDVSQAHPEERRNLRFMQELRHLFALMVGSQKKYVDPSRAVDILKEAFSSNIVANTGVSDSQQDVSEFQHKLLEWLEDSFKTSSRSASPSEGTSPGQKSADNPMVDLFYGQYRADGVNEGKGFSNEENFGQFPLQVNGFRDIHESLEATTAHREIESINNEATQKSGQELWFTRLPPVLTFELSRFQFNQQLGRPEKIHNKLEFPQIIYMDRYMDFNREKTRERREKAKKLKEELVALQARLDKFVNYGSGSKRFPLQDVLLYALEFAKSRRDSDKRQVTVLSQDIDMESPSPNTSMLTDSPVKSPPDVAMVTVKSPTETSSDVTMTSVSKSPSLPNPDIPMPTDTKSLSSTPPDVSMVMIPKTPPRPTHTPVKVESPGPRHVSDAELHVLQDCLQRWRKEVESDVRELQENIGTLEDSINKMYSDEAMTKYPYQLHAVLVHEGQAASGHYWAYIYDMSRDHWLKFNDITVSEASWDELEKESVGGYHNASAYCLMYVDKTRITSETVEGRDDPSLTSDLENLPDDLKEIVSNDNKAFSEEIERWDRDLARRATGGGDADSDVSIVGEPRPAVAGPGAGSSCTSSVSTQTSQTANKVSLSVGTVHANLSILESTRAVCSVLETDILETKGVEEAFSLVVDNESKRIQRVVSELHQAFPLQDPRLQHIVVYLWHCRCPCNHTLKRILYEQFVEVHVREHVERSRRFRTYAINALEHLVKESTEETERQYKFWHETYQIYRKTAFYFIKGTEYYLEEKFEIALPFLVHAHSFNMALEQRATNAALSDIRISSFFLRQCLLHLNDTVTQHFEERSDVKDVNDLLSVMNSLVLPCLPILLRSGFQDDITAAEEIREKWCSFLGQDLDAYRVEKLQDFLSKLFEPAADIRLPRSPSIRSGDISSLGKQYRQVMEEAHKCGYIERAVKAS